MSEERVVMKSKIPVKAKSCIPVRIDVNKKSATVSHKTTAGRNKPASAVQGVTSKERLKSGRPEISTNKTLKTKQLNQVKKEICTKPSFKETNRARLNINNPSKTLGKSCKAVKASTPVPKNKIKVQPTKSKNIAESHPSQPDIEFVPDEISRKRILSCTDLPSAPNAMSRGQTSIYDRPSLYRMNPIVRPADPCKALLKTLQSLKIKDRESVQGTNWRESVQGTNWRESVQDTNWRESVQGTNWRESIQSTNWRESIQSTNWRESVQSKNWRESIQSTNWRESFSFNRPSVNKIGLKPPDFAALKTLENIDCRDGSSLKQSGMQATFGCFPLARKTPKMVLDEAKKRFQEQKFKEENKSVKKVTFQVLNSALGKENKCLIESKSVDVKKTVSESLTPDLKLRKMLSMKDETPTTPPVKISSKESQVASLLNSNLPKKPVSILKNKIFPEMDVRRGSLFCSRPMRTGFGKLRRSISFSNFPPPSPRQTSAIHGNPSNHRSGIQGQSFDPVDDPKLPGQQSSPAFLRRSLSSPEFSALCSSIAAPLLPSTPRSEVQACGANALSPASRTILKLQSIQNNNLADKLRSSVSASGLRGSLFLTNNLREVPRSKNPKLCTPVPVSLYPRSQTAESFSPEFLCPRTSNYIVDAPIKTPLVLKNLAAREENDDLNHVRQKLIFVPPAEEKPKHKSLTYVHKQNKQDYSADQECSSILCRAIFPFICSQNILNPLAKTLENGDEMHFVPVSPCP